MKALTVKIILIGCISTSRAQNNNHFDSSIDCQLQKVKEIQSVERQYQGQLFAIGNVPSPNEYVIELKYSGRQKIRTFHVHTLAYWWQKPYTKVLLFVSPFCVLIGYHKYKDRKTRLTEEKLKQQLRSSQTKLNPHFVFNAMSSISGLINSEQNERAEEYLNNFSDIMRTTLVNSNQLFIPLSDELDCLQKYIVLEQLGIEFRFELIIDPELNLDTIDLPPLLLQPSVENAVKHGVGDLGQQGVIQLSLLKQANDLLILIKDNGKPTKEHTTKPGTGYGITLTKERIEVLGKLFPKDKIIYGLEFNENGAIASFRFENWLT
ncbi:MAG: histidine kinase [Chitinophagaceae bacterium]|nr:histidine kinase [Chitinophagaceae bacterium]